MPLGHISDKNDEARQAKFLRGKLKKWGETLEKLKKDLQSKDVAFKEEKGHVEVLLRAVVDSLSGTFFCLSPSYPPKVLAFFS